MQQLIYTKTGQPVAVGDTVLIGGKRHRISHFAPPRHANSSGKVTVCPEGGSIRDHREYFVLVIGAAWIRRGDQDKAVGASD